MEEEWEALGAIFSEREEMVILDKRTAKLNLKSRNSDSIGFSVTFQMPDSYPQSETPIISVSSESMNRQSCRDFTDSASKEAHGLIGQPMLYQLAEWMRDNVHQFQSLKEETKSEPDEVTDHVLLIELDHMRDRKNYSNTLKSWARDLCLSGRLIIAKRISILLGGKLDDLKCFEKRLRTSKVDVDSSGKKCKEKMMKVLCCEKAEPHKITDFVILEDPAPEEVARAFREFSLSNLHREYNL